MVRREQSPRSGTPTGKAPNGGSRPHRAVRASLFGRPQVKTEKDQNRRTDRDGKEDMEISPGSNNPPSQRSPSSVISDASLLNHFGGDFGGHRRELAVLQGSGASSNPKHASSPPDMPFDWSLVDSSAVMPSSAFPESSFGDSTDNFGAQMAANNSQTGFGKTNRLHLGQLPSSAFPDDERRPSLASMTTVSSGGSRASPGRPLHKKLHGFFGDDYQNRVTPQSSQTSLPGRADDGGAFSFRIHRRDRNESSNTAGSTEAWAGSRPGSRPHTPVPSNDVVPFIYQDPDDISQYGDAPVRRSPAGPDKQRYMSVDGSNHSSMSGAHTSHGHHNPFSHKHKKQKEPTSHPQSLNTEKSLPQRPNQPWPDSPLIAKSAFDASSPGLNLPSDSGLAVRASSPTPSGQSNRDRDVASNSKSSAKKGLFGLFKKSNRNHDRDSDSQRNLIGNSRAQRGSTTNGSTQMRNGSTVTVDSARDARNAESDQKKGRGHRHLRGLRGPNSEGNAAKDESADKDTSQSALYHLDTDFSNMSDIVSQPYTDMKDGGIFTGADAVESTEPQKVLDQHNGKAGANAEWNAPESWAVKKVEDENMTRLREIDEAGVAPTDDDDGLQYSVRVFRVDGTFATLSTGLNSTAAEILNILGKKSFLQTSLDSYQIVMKKHDMQRVLESGERPLAIQKRLLNQAGYSDIDRLDEIGREDNSYLCRFTFVPSKLSGYYSLEKDPDFSRTQKFSRVDLAGRNLMAIPITLYQKATEIVSLNLSRNLSLDIPKDFIQSCLNLRDIKYISNEAWKLPPSLSLALRLTYLDISNNRLEQLEHAELDKLHSLVSLKMSNNRISHVPTSFASFKDLRILNMSSNFLEEVPDFLCDLTSLVELDISFNSVSSFPSKIGNLKRLEKLAANNNKFTGPFPEAFSGLENLKEVDVRFNAISSIDVCSQLPQLEHLIVSHNAISAFEGTFHKLRNLILSHNPVTRFAILNPVLTLTKLNLGSAKLAQLPDSLYEKIPNLDTFVLDKNHFVSLSPQIGKLQKLEYLSIARNPLNSLPAEIGCLLLLRVLDVREGNLKKLPSEIWCMLKLETLNVSSNVLETFPKPATSMPMVPSDTHYFTPVTRTNTLGTPQLSTSPSFEELGKLEDFGARRPSQASGGLLSVGSSPAGSQRNGSIVSVYGPGGRKASVFSRTTSSDTLMTPVARKDSNLSAAATKVAVTFSSSLRHLYLADNRLNDDCFDYISLLPELRVLNLSYNELYDMPPKSLERWPHLVELYLSGNELTTLPSEDFDEQSCLRILHINGNRFQVLPAELGKLHKLTVLDCGSNTLKYNVSNWPYDWNWNWNVNLKYLNLSGNKRLEIKPSAQVGTGRDERNLTDFGALHHLRVLGLMDVTLTIPTVPDQTEDRRVRTSGSLAGSLTYGMADSLGRNEHLSTIDMVVPRFRGREGETLLGLFDGQALSSGGSKVAKFLHENFGYHFNEELNRMMEGESPVDALRRTFLALNKDLATAANQNLNERPPHLAHRGSVATAPFTSDDLKSGGVATIMYLQGMELFVANVGDAQAMLLQSDGGYKVLTRKHDPAEASERQRIREAGGYVSLKGKLNDQLEVSRAFGYIDLMPAVQANPHIARISLKEQDEMIVVASKELWEYLTLEYACDVARSERGDLMRAAQKLRDLAIAFGASNKIMVMMVGVSDLKKRERNRYRGQSLSMGPTGVADEQLFPTRSGKRRLRDGPDDSALARLDPEVFAPTGDLSIVFTDIKNSTSMWETFPIAMRAAIKMHNDIMRRQLRIIGGYEVKTEGDAFMVSFPTATSALLWTFSVQSQLLDAPWPQEILSSVHGQEITDVDGSIIFRGLSVRMGIHWGEPVCEPDPVTRRMDYFGPMVNKTSRISSVADGGQITVSTDFIGEIQRALETYSESDRNGSTGSEDTLNDDATAQAIRKELRLLSSQGFEVKDLGERKLKGLENPEYVFLMYPHSLAGRLLVKQKEADAAAAITNQPGSLSRDSQLTIDTDCVWSLWNVSLRLEMLCSTLESPGSSKIKPPELALLERIQNRGGELSDEFLVNLVEHMITRVEACINTLMLRHLINPFHPAKNLLQLACPMGDIMSKLSDSLAELAEYREGSGGSRGRRGRPR